MEPDIAFSQPKPKMVHWSSCVPDFTSDPPNQSFTKSQNVFEFRQDCHQPDAACGKILEPSTKDVDQPKQVVPPRRENGSVWSALTAVTLLVDDVMEPVWNRVVPLGDTVPGRNLVLLVALLLAAMSTFTA